MITIISDDTVIIRQDRLDFKSYLISIFSSTISHRHIFRNNIIEKERTLQYESNLVSGTSIRRIFQVFDYL